MTTTPGESHAVVAYAAGDLRVEQRPLAVPGPDEAIIRIAYGGVCGSDLHYWTHGVAGESVLRDPMILGHEVVGTVAVAAADGSGPTAGTPVAVHPATPGGSGARYPANRPNLSPGCTYLGSAATRPHKHGAFAEYAVLPARMLRVLPEGMPMRRAALIEPASVAWHAVSRAEDVNGAKALVIGSGPIGALTIAVLKRAGAAEIVAVDSYEKPLQIARELGATHAINARDTEAVAAVEADVTMESSGSTQGLASAIQGTMRGGRIVMLGLIPSGAQPVPISLAISRELELAGSFRFNDEIDDVIAALADGSLQIDAAITHEFPYQRAEEAFSIARDAQGSGKVLLRF